MISSGQATIGTAATIIDGTHHAMFSLIISNMDNTDTLFLGGPDVTAANGLSLPKGNFIQIEMNPGDALYAVSNKTGHIVSWLKQV